MREYNRSRTFSHYETPEGSEVVLDTISLPLIERIVSRWVTDSGDFWAAFGNPGINSYRRTRIVRVTQAVNRLYARGHSLEDVYALDFMSRAPVQANGVYPQWRFRNQKSTPFW